jgi:hypothetical protein
MGLFQYADGTTRIVSIWDQIISGSPPPNFNFGTEYSRDTINAALKLENPMELVPSMDELGHGRMVAGIAAGNEGNAKRHYYGSVNHAMGKETVELLVGENEKGFVMELWGYPRYLLHRYYLALRRICSQTILQYQ